MGRPDTDARMGRGPSTWRAEDEAPHPPPGPLGWALAILRGLGLIAILLFGVICLLVLRAVEFPVSGARRPLTGPWVMWICRACLLVVGLRWRREGQPMQGPGAVVANHSSWLDIFVLNAAMPIFFVSKAEVAGWPGINILTWVTKTHFVRRDPTLARQQADEFAARVRAGHRLLFFPEGTSTDGRRVLPFKPTLFQGFLSPDLPDGLALQPVTAIYEAPVGQDARFYGWWGDMALGPHLLTTLAQPRQGRVTVVLHPPVPVVGRDRKQLARACETAVREALETRLGKPS